MNMQYVMEELKYVSEQLEEFGISESRTNIYRLHLKIADIIKFLENKESKNENE